jgi:aspartyl-tRNA(Asn)/glutamyl-tRNA(Gln) amidotransferase subunit A
MNTTDIASLSLAEAGRLVREREVSPVDLTDACLAQIERLEPDLNAYITVTADEARQAAKKSSDEISGGRQGGQLHGIPVAIKDLFDLAGVRMTAGSRILAENMAVEDSESVSRLKVAGATILGKLNLHEFAFGATGVNPHYGAARNPWNTECVTGGSSSGSGAAVAAGECFAALGTDTGGSIRIPASLCGIVGLKPTYGRVSKRGVFPLSWSLDHVGPMTRTVEDAAILLGVLAGHDPGDGSSADRPVPNYTSALKAGIRGLRVGVPRRFFFENVDLEVDAAVRSAIQLLEELGAVVSDIDIPHIEEIPGALTAIMLPEALAIHQRWMNERPDDYGDDVRYRLELGSTYLAVHYVQAQRLRQKAVQSWSDDVFGKVDLIASPATPITAPLIEHAGGSTYAGGALQVTFSLIRFTNPFNFLGVPAISVPCGFTSEGLPIGLQLAGRWWDEENVLRAAYAYEQTTDWHKRRPPSSQ